MWLSEVKAKANRANNPKGYLINAMKRQVKQAEQKSSGIAIKEAKGTRKVGTKTMSDLLNGIQVHP